MPALWRDSPVWVTSQRRAAGLNCRHTNCTVLSGSGRDKMDMRIAVTVLGYLFQWCSLSGPSRYITQPLPETIEIRMYLVHLAASTTRTRAEDRRLPADVPNAAG